MKKAISAARAAGHPISLVPGPSAVTSAVALSGFGGDRFVFEGFLPKKGGERETVLARVVREDRPVVMFVSPHRFQADIESLAGAAGVEREVAVMRELTKLHEEVWVGPLGAAVDKWRDHQVKGEVTIVLAPGSTEGLTLEAAVEAARREVAAGTAPSEAARSVAEASGVSRRAIYQELISDEG